MSFTCEEELYWVHWVVNDFLKTFEVSEQKVCTFVCCKTTTETDNQCVRVDTIKNWNDFWWVVLVFQPHCCKLIFDISDQFVFQCCACSPNFFVWHIVDCAPNLHIRLVAIEVVIEIFFVKCFPFWSSPCWHVNTISYIANVKFFREITFPNWVKHLLAHFAVQPAHTVNTLASVTSKYRHREFLVCTWIFATHIHKVVPWDTKFSWIFAHIFTEETFVETVVTSWHWSVTSVKAWCSYYFESFLHAKTFSNIVRKTLKVEECCVTFVAVIKFLVDTKFLECKHTTNTEHNLLFDTVFPIATIELVSDLTVKFAIEFHICIEKEQRHTTYLSFPYVSINHAVWIRHFYDYRVTSFVFHLSDRKVAELLWFVVSNLLTINAKCLSEITKTIQETDSHHIYIAIRCLFDIVASEHTKTARIDFEVVSQTILHWEISNWRNVSAVFLIHISSEFCIYCIKFCKICFIFCQFVKTIQTSIFEHADWIVTTIFPHLCVHVAE